VDYLYGKENKLNTKRVRCVSLQRRVKTLVQRNTMKTDPPRRTVITMNFSLWPFFVPKLNEFIKWWYNCCSYQRPY